MVVTWTQPSDARHLVSSFDAFEWPHHYSSYMGRILSPFGLHLCANTEADLSNMTVPILS